MLKIAICDDEISSIEQLSTIISKYCQQKKINYIIDKYLSGNQLLQCFKHYNILFLDIKMDGLDGIEIAKKIRQADKFVKIIYVTNFLNYQTDAFTVRAFGYVIKPFNEEVIFKQLDDAIEYSKQEHNRIELTFNTDKGIKNIDINEIFLFEAFNHKTTLTCKSQKYSINDSIKNIFNKINSSGFAMPHKSFIVNMRYISKIQGYNIIMTNEAYVPISQKRAVEFKSEFHLFLKNNFKFLI